MATLNMDLVGLYDRMNRFINEIQKSQSANVSAVTEPDFARTKTYLSTLRFLIEHIDNQPQLDLPEQNPQEYSLLPAPSLLDIENESCKHLALMLSIARDELIASQSSRMSTGLIVFDKSRLLAVLQKADNYLDDFVKNSLPIDLPESSPRAPVQGKGLNGLGNA